MSELISLAYMNISITTSQPTIYELTYQTFPLNLNPIHLLLHHLPHPFFLVVLIVEAATTRVDGIDGCKSACRGGETIVAITSFILLE